MSVIVTVFAITKVVIDQTPQTNSFAMDLSTKLEFRKYFSCMDNLQTFLDMDQYIMARKKAFGSGNPTSNQQCSIYFF